MKENKEKYMTPTVKVVGFMVESGFAGSPDRVVQPDSGNDGMNEKMQDGSSLGWGWDWNSNSSSDE